MCLAWASGDPRKSCWSCVAHRLWDLCESLCLIETLYHPLGNRALSLSVCSEAVVKAAVWQHFADLKPCQALIFTHGTLSFLLQVSSLLVRGGKTLGYTIGLCGAQNKSCKEPENCVGPVCDLIDSAVWNGRDRLAMWVVGE